MTVAPEVLDVRTAQLRELITDRRFRPLVHGTVGGYHRCRPRCDECKKAWAAYVRGRYQSMRKELVARRAALESLAARHPSEFLMLLEKAQKGSQ